MPGAGGMALSRCRLSLSAWSWLLRSGACVSAKLELDQNLADIAAAKQLVIGAQHIFNAVCHIKRRVDQTLIQPFFQLRGELVPLIHERSEEHTSELQSRENLVCRLLLEKNN